mgnify:FL=1
MEPPFADTKATKTERIYAQYISVCARIGQATAKPTGQNIPQGKLEKLYYERLRLQLELGDFFEVR